MPFPKRTVNFINDFDKVDADLFTKLCGFCWEIIGPVPFILNTWDEIYKANGITYNNIRHLESIGLVHFNDPNIFSLPDPSEKFLIQYYEQPLAVNLENVSSRSFTLGHVIFTKLGKWKRVISYL